MIYYTDIDIWMPRYHDKAETGSWTVLVACYKVKDAGAIRVKFTKAKHLTDVRLYMAASRLKSYPKETNGTIECYAVPYNDFSVKPLEADDDICMKHNAIKLKSGLCPMEVA